jgi:hypothetical protein
MKFFSFRQAAKWLASVRGWFIVEPVVADDDQGCVTANTWENSRKERMLSRPGYYQNDFTGRALEDALRSAKIEACNRLRAYMNGEEA